MRFADLVALAWRQLRERRLRTILTIMAVAVGVTVIIALSSMVEEVRVSMLTLLQSLGPDTVIVAPRGRMPISYADVVRIRSLEGVRSVIPLLLLSARIPGSEEQVLLVGVSSYNLIQLLGSLNMLAGDLFLDVPAPQAVIGYEVAYDPSTGQQVVSQGEPLVLLIQKRTVVLTVVGILDRYGTSLGPINVDGSVFVPIDYVERLAPRMGYNLVIVKSSSVENVEDVAELLRYAMGNRARVVAVKQVSEVVSSAMTGLNMLLIGVASTSFVAAGLGTLNIMMVSVLERVREIGVLKALGMKSRQVLALYMLQGLLIGVVGSIVGIVVGLALASLLPWMGVHILPFPSAAGGSMRSPYGNVGAFLASAIVPRYIVLASLISITVSLLSSAYPSWRAARLSPVEALRYE